MEHIRLGEIKKIGRRKYILKREAFLQVDCYESKKKIEYIENQIKEQERAKNIILVSTNFVIHRGFLKTTYGKITITYWKALNSEVDLEEGSWWRD